MIRLYTRLKTAVLIVILAFVVAGCANIRQGVAWPALGTIDINNSTYLVVSYEQQIELLDPTTGQIARLRDAEGEVLLDPDGEAQRWLVNGSDFEDAQFFTTPVSITEDGERTLLFPTYNNRILEFYAQSARVVNPTGIAIGGGVISDMIITDDLLYVPYSNGDVVAFERDTYEELWRVDTTEGVWASPLLADGVLYVPSIDHFLYAADAETGDVIWDDPVDLEGAVTSTPILYDGHIYVGSYSHSLYKIDLDGNIVDTYEGENWIWGSPQVYDDTIYYTDLSGYVYALTADDLNEVWVDRPATRGIRPAPLVTEDFVVVASRNGLVYWLDRETGAIVNEREVEGTPELLSELALIPADSEAGIEDDIVVVGSTNNRNLVAAFLLDNSLPLWVYGR